MPPEHTISQTVVETQNYITLGGALPGFFGDLTPLLLQVEQLGF